MPIHRLSSDDLEKDYKLIAIHSDIEPYKLAFEINKKLKIKLKRSSFDLSFKNKSSIFYLYKHISEVFNTKLYLILNKSTDKKKIEGQLLFENFDEQSYLIPELRKAQYLLKIEGGGFDVDNLLKKLNEIDNVISSYRTEISSIKSKYNLIFE
tara:strand:- start:113 stop:571 length:459 start_codon:yes stop_codon:yes gene_type:complete